MTSQSVRKCKQKSFLCFETLSTTGNTLYVKVVSASSGFRLGVIKWYSHWRCYSFHPDDDTVYDVRCLDEISFKLDELNTAHKKALADAKTKTF